MLGARICKGAKDENWLNIAAAGPSLLHVATSAADLRARGLDVRSGQRLAGLVLHVAGDKVLVELSGVPVVARTTVPLQEGQRFAVTVGESEGDVILLRVNGEAAASTDSTGPRARVSTPPATLRALTTADLRASLEALGLSASDLTLAAAEALVERGLTLSPRNIEYVARNLEILGGPPAETARALAAARTLDLPPTRQIVELLRAALAPTPGSALTDRVAALEEALAGLSGRVPPPAGANASPEALRNALLGALASLAAQGGETAEPAALLLASTQVAPDRASALLASAASLRPTFQNPLVLTVSEAARAGEAMGGLLTEVREGLRELGAALRGSDGPAASDSLRETSALILGHARQLDYLSTATDAPDGAVRNTLIALRTALEPHLHPEIVTTSATTDLAARVSSLLDQLSAALQGEEPAGLSDARRLLAAVMDRLDQGVPGGPGERLRTLAEAVASAARRIGPPTGWETPPVRAFARELAAVEAYLRSPEAAADPRQAVAEAMAQLREGLTLVAAASSTRQADLVALFASRVASETNLVLVDSLSGDLESLDTALRAARAALGLSAIATSEYAPERLSAMDVALSRALAGLGRGAESFASLIEDALSGSDLEGVRTLGATLGEALSARPERSPTAELVELVARLRIADLAGDALPEALRTVLTDARRGASGDVRARLRTDVGELASVLARLTVAPREGSAPVGAALRTAGDMLAVSTEYKLLTGEPAERADGDLRAALGRVARGAEQLLAVDPPTVDAAGDLPERLVRLAQAARSLATFTEAQQLVNASSVKMGAPLVAYIQVPVTVGDERHLAELKVLRDPSRGTDEIDPDNATVAIRLDTRTLGLVIAVMRTVNGVLNVTFTMETPEYQRAVSREARGLQESLTRAGFDVGAVATEVRERSAQVFERIGAVMPEGATISLLA